LLHRYIAISSAGLKVEFVVVIHEVWVLVSGTPDFSLFYSILLFCLFFFFPINKYLFEKEKEMQACWELNPYPENRGLVFISFYFSAHHS
jgi:hypothetical protein